MKKFFTSLISVFLILGCMMGAIGCGETNSTPPSLNVPSTSESTFSQEPSSTLSSSSSSSSSSSYVEPEVVLPEEALNYFDASKTSFTATEQADLDKLFYVNNFNTTSADPACVYNKEDGYYYMYGTGHSSFNCYRSKDLTGWEPQTAAFKQPKNMTYANDIKGTAMQSRMSEAEFNTYKNNTWLKYDYDWAPGVIYDEDLGLYLMFFSARYTLSDPVKLQLSLAYSTSAKGPYVQWTGTVNGANGKAGVNEITYKNGQKVPAYNIGYGDVFIDFERLNGINGNYPYEGYIKAIDVEPFVDPVTGKKYLFFCRDLGDRYEVSCSMGMEMIDWFTPDYSTLTMLTKPNYKKITDLMPSFSDEGDVNEGQYVVYNPDNGLYYLTYSCNGYVDRTYKVKQAWAESPLGPYTKIDSTQGGYVMATDLTWKHRAGTGHHVFTRVGNEMFIVYHMHKNPIQFSGSTYSGQRVIATDRVSWVENEEGLLVMNCGGPSSDYRFRPEATSGYKNLSKYAYVTTSQQKEGAKLEKLWDGGIQVFYKEGIGEFDAKNEPLTVTFSYNNPITLKAIMAFNSHYIETAFDYISKIEVEFTRNGEKIRGYTDKIIFDWDKYYKNNSKKYLPGCSSTAVFEEINNVSKIKIYFQNQKWDSVVGLSVSDIQIIGK